ncbi:MAG: flavin reductase family protein [Armatimonadota bacterium]|nr:flavin reductase family protein [Armatimonadota bacterium]MDR7452410.1 flavin reductase family protein [Armatimonadota bacterium]MDR7468099.1 flavin reductase family protein [Armatimonadota bacterium]MDR7494669.1 flavin reductase family protein [Armatimonadota bacterium]MDR7500198.1 flavin reductase family protein [Armatimonadota bacterium]
MSTPGAEVDPDRFRKVMGRFATGVTVVAAEHDGEMHGMTANAVTSVSLDPLLLLVCVGRRARMSRWLERAGGFTVNILTEDQEALSRYFAGTWPHAAPPEFRFVPWEGGPRLVAALAALGCRRERLIEAGDHRIVLGRVIALYEGDAAAQPLLFYGGRYRRLSPAEAAPAPELWTGTDVRIYYDEWWQGPR